MAQIGTGQGFIFSLERKQQKEKHSAPTHIVVVMTGNGNGWEISVIVFTLSFTVIVGPSVTGVSVAQVFYHHLIPGLCFLTVISS